MGERSPLKKGDEVWVKATVEDFWTGPVRPDRQWVTVSFEGRIDTTTVQAELVTRFDQRTDWIDDAFGGMPDGAVEVSRERWLELQDQGEVRTVTVRTVESEAGGKIGGMTTRYFEVVSRG